MLDIFEDQFSTEVWLAEHQNALTKAMFPKETPPERVNVLKLVEKPMRIVVRMDGNGKQIIAKGFNPEAPRGAEANLKEVGVLEKLAGTDLCPKLLGYSKAGHWFIMEYVEGRRLDMVLSPENAEQYAKALGRWYRSYTETLAHESVLEPTNWFTYLKKVDVIGKQKTFKEFRELLEPLKIEQRVTAVCTTS